VYLAPASDSSLAPLKGAVYYESPSKDDNGKPHLLVTAFDHEGEPVFHLRYFDGTEFMVNRTGSEVRGWWRENSTLDDTVAYLLGPVLGFVLRLRGVVALHGSAVDIGGTAIALIGPHGAGKSTAAAAFAQRGCPVLCDDVVALMPDAAGFLALPGYPHLRLWEQSAQALFSDAEELPQITPSWEKRYLDLKARGYEFSSGALPLSAIYLLSDRVPQLPGARIELITGASALIALVANTYCNYMLDSEMRAKEFRQLHRLVNCVVMRTVSAPDDCGRVHEVCDAIAQDAATASAPAVTSS